jgi:hypothetical protein
MSNHHQRDDQAAPFIISTLSSPRKLLVFAGFILVIGSIFGPVIRQSPVMNVPDSIVRCLGGHEPDAK